MPLVKYLGNSTAQDNTEIINLANDKDGVPRSLRRGGDALDVTGEELRALAANYEIEVLEDSAETNGTGDGSNAESFDATKVASSSSPSSSSSVPSDAGSTAAVKTSAPTSGAAAAIPSASDAPASPGASG